LDLPAQIYARFVQSEATIILQKKFPSLIFFVDYKSVGKEAQFTKPDK